MNAFIDFRELFELWRQSIFVLGTLARSLEPKLNAFLGLVILLQYFLFILFFRFEVKKWNAVALWAWDIVVDNCAICRNHIMDLCIECQANQASVTSEECTVAWGKWIIHFAMIDLEPNVLKSFLKSLWYSTKFYTATLQHFQIGKHS